MGERADQIEREIRRERGELDKNLHELEQRVRDTTDWRVQFSRHPMLMMGVALGAGVALSTAMGGKSRGAAASIRRLEEASPQPREPKSNAPNPLKDTWNTLKGALIGVGTDRLCNFIDELVPGFERRYREKAGSFSSTRRSAA